MINELQPWEWRPSTKGWEICVAGVWHGPIVTGVAVENIGAAHNKQVALLNSYTTALTEAGLDSVWQAIVKVKMLRSINAELLAACKEAISYEQTGRGEPKSWLASCAAAVAKAEVEEGSAS